MIDSWLYQRRKIVNALALTACVLGMSLGLGALACILGTLLARGLPGVRLSLFTELTPAPGDPGGLANAIWGSALITGLGTALGTPVGILAGTYLAEFGGRGPAASVIRFVNGILLSAPSVIIGFFVYASVVVHAGHFSGWAGALALSLILIPVVVNATETMLRLVPNALREAAAALGAPRWKITFAVTYRAARAGILTGVLLGVARIGGESAPLLFTALNNQFFSTDLNRPTANLPVTIFQFAMSPFDEWQDLAWAGALLITITVLILNVTARTFLRRKA